MKQECKLYVCNFQEFQAYGNANHSPIKELQSIVSPWPFSIWGMNFVALFPMAKGQVKYRLPYSVVTDNERQFTSSSLCSMKA
ncbi:hypothetical protein CR513_13646, partial [Mucuna pruriens]